MKRFLIFCIAVVIVLCCGISASASVVLTATLDKESCTAGEYLRVKVDYSGDSIGAFLADMEYDPNSLRYVRTDNDSGDYVKSAESSGIVRTVYTYKDKGEGTLFTVVFKVLPGAEKADIAIRLYDAVDINAMPLMEDKSFSLSSEVIIPSGEALLLDLVPSTGELNEDFSPYTREYTMSVPYEVDSVSFQVTVSQGAKCSINRKNLGPGGSTTDFLFTVKSEDESAENIYTVKVTRGEYVRPAGNTSGTEPDENATDGNLTSENNYETITPEFTGEDESLPGNTENSYPQQSTTVERAETAVNTGNTMVWFLAGAGVCLVCVMAGVLIAKLFGNTGKHGKH